MWTPKDAALIRDKKMILMRYAIIALKMSVLPTWKRLL